MLLPPARLAWVIAQRNEPIAPSALVGSAANVASTPPHEACSIRLGATAASINPVRYSSAQLPPAAAAPVRSVLAATSAPVNAARSFTKCWPAAVSATSQPYSRRSAPGASALLQAAISPARRSSVCSSSVVLPSCNTPSPPCANTCIALMSSRPASVAPIKSSPSCPAWMVTISIGRPAFCCACRSPSSNAASGNAESTNTISLRCTATLVEAA